MSWENNQCPSSLPGYFVENTILGNTVFPKKNNKNDGLSSCATPDAQHKEA